MQAVIEDDGSEEVPSDFWNWVNGLWQSHPKIYGLREEQPGAKALRGLKGLQGMQGLYGFYGP